MNKFAENLLRIAKSDIKASNYLYNKRFYSQSFFSFQQAAEKANKAFGLLDQLIGEDGLKKVSHQSAKVQRNAVRQKKLEVEELIYAYTKNPMLNTITPFKDLDINGYYQKLNDIQTLFDKRYNEEIINIPLITLNDILYTLYEINDSKFKMPQEFKDSFKSKMLEYADGFGKLGKIKGKDEIYEVMKDDDQVKLLCEYLIKYFEELFQIQKIHTVIFVCAFITSHHCEAARYPNKGKDPLKTYTKKLPVVKLQPEFMDLLENAIKKILKYCKN